MSIIPFRNFKRFDIWRDQEDEGRLHTRVIQDPQVLVLPPEYDAYLKKFGHIYRIEKSDSGFSWVLTYDDGTWGWDQKGWYCKTLVLCRNGDLKTALEKAKICLLGEHAFWVENGFIQEKLPDDEEFEKWLSSL